MGDSPREQVRDRGVRIRGQSRTFFEEPMLTDSELAATRRIQDRVMAQQRHDWDLSAKDNHSKSERFHFAVVGEGTHVAQGRYRANYDLIDWEK